MKQFFSEFFEIDENTLEEYGTFNISLLSDLPLFIDPFLLFTSKKPEYIELHQEIIKYLRFLRDKAVEDELNDGLIDAWYKFPEVKQNWLGYSKTSNKGSGLGTKFANALTLNLKIFHQSVHKRLSKNHFEKLCLINSGVGKDNISDFTTNLIKEYLLNYTQEFAKKYIHKKFREIHRVKRVRFDYEVKHWIPVSFELPTYDDDYIILTPVDMLTKDETWINRPEFTKTFRLVIDSVPDATLRAQFTNHLENKLLELAGEEKPTAKQETEAVNDTILHFPEIIEYYVKDKEENGKQAESISSSKVIESKQLYIKHFKKLGIKLLETTKFYSIESVSYKDSLERLEIIKKTVERESGNEIFYFDGKPIEDEDNLSILFRLTWKASQFGVIDENSSEIITTWKDSKKKLKIVLKQSKNQQLKKTLEKLKNIYDKSLPEQEYILVLIYYSEEELPNIKYLLKAMDMSEHKNIVFINAGKDEDEEIVSDLEISEEKSISVSNNFENGYALIIGVGKDLPVTVDDATALHDILVNPNRAAYPHKQVALLTETSAKRKSILESFDKLIEQSNRNPNATVVIYYSGHGGKLTRENKYFLVPYGFDSSRLKETGISGQEFTEKIQALKARKIIVFLDCCHAGGISTIKGIEETFVKSPVPQDLINALSHGSGKVIIASSREDEYSYTGTPYSVFTDYLVQALTGKGTKNYDGYAKILDILSYLFEKVPEHTSDKQHPFVPHIANLSDNFPVCYYAGGSKQIEGVLDSTPDEISQTSNNLTDGECSRLKRMLEGLQEQYDILAEKVKLFRKQVSIEAGVSIKFQLEKELLVAETELSNVETKMTEIERKLNKF